MATDLNEESLEYAALCETATGKVTGHFAQKQFTHYAAAEYSLALLHWLERPTLEAHELLRTKALEAGVQNLAESLRKICSAQARAWNELRDKIDGEFRIFALYLAIDDPLEWLERLRQKFCGPSQAAAE